MSMIGKTLAHYEITNQLGKGGMGEVYQAKDRKLGRDVAIKVLPEEFARDTDRVARFQREAKLLASLNHTNIAAIYGLEASEGTNFLVLELVEGETLADQLKRGPIPVEESLKLALQIAEALEAAHEKGVIHRDLKPANIKVTPDGKVKVLDFGLAKAFAGEQADLNLSNSPTLSNAATQQGVILGTAAYMSPEQASGKTVDKRADVWALGVVLYEMLTGRSLFAGDNVSQTLARVLERQPDFSLLPKNLHFRVVDLLKRCLQKESKNRYHDIADIRLDLQEVLADPIGVLVQPVTTAEPRTRLRTMLPWIAAALVLGLIIAGVAVWNLRRPEPKQVVRFTYELPEHQQFGDLMERALAVSPNDSQLVYTTNKGLYLHTLAELDATFISGTEGAQKPFFSPDGQWIGYVNSADRKLKKILIKGGTPVSLINIASVGSISWGKDDAIVYSGAGGVMRVSSNGENPALLAEGGKGIYFAPQILPDGKTVLYTFGPPYKIMLQSLVSGERKELLAGDSAQYLPTGHIVYGVEDNLYAVPFDLERLEVTGIHTPVVEGVLRAGGAPQFAVSDSETLIYMPRTEGAIASRNTLVGWTGTEMKNRLQPHPTGTTPPDCLLMEPKSPWN
jgi:serine/threonine protein kinase